MPQIDKDFNEFVYTFERACKSIDRRYFSVKFAGDKRNKIYYKERVYTYELYHNLRTLLDNSRYTLAGEMDKSGNSAFPNELQDKIPDLIVHIPETDSWNLAVIEVKSTVSFNKGGGLVNDLKKLTDFIDKDPHYIGGIELFFGDCEEMQFSHKIVDFLNNNLGVSERTKCLVKDGKIRILFHCAPNSVPKALEFDC